MNYGTLTLCIIRNIRRGACHHNYILSFLYIFPVKAKDLADLPGHTMTDNTIPNFFTD